MDSNMIVSKFEIQSLKYVFISTPFGKAWTLLSLPAMG